MCWNSDERIQRHRNCIWTKRWIQVIKSYASKSVPQRKSSQHNNNKKLPSLYWGLLRGRRGGGGGGVYTCMFLVLISWLVVMHIEEEAMWLVGILLLYLWLYPIAVASSPDLPVVCGKSICLMLLFQGHATCRKL